MHFYGGKQNVMLVGVNDFGNGIPTPFVATADRTAMGKYIDENQAGTAIETPAMRKLLLDAFDQHGIVMAFDNPDAAQRMLALLSFAFEHAAEGPWGDIGDDERTLQ